LGQICNSHFAEKEILGRSVFCAVSNIVSSDLVIPTPELAHKLAYQSTQLSLESFNFFDGELNCCRCPEFSERRTAFLSPLQVNSLIDQVSFTFLIHEITDVLGFSMGVLSMSSIEPFYFTSPIDFGKDDNSVGVSILEKSMPFLTGDIVQIFIDPIERTTRMNVTRMDSEFNYQWENHFLDNDELYIGVTFTPGSAISVSKFKPSSLKNDSQRRIFFDHSKKPFCGMEISEVATTKNYCGCNTSFCTSCKSNEFLGIDSNRVYSDGGECPLVYCGCEIENSDSNEDQDQEFCIPVR
jgi:hypothetical protein